jgi:glycosyltransferase involved in cell wall biosynthesis
MKITILTAGTGSYYCGACMRDNALAKSLHQSGHEVEMLPMYLPLSLDEDVLASSRELPVFFGGINVYLQQKFSLFRHTPGWLDRMLNGPGLLRGAASRSHMTSARDHGEMALEMLRLEDSKLTKELDKLLAWLEGNKPELLCLSNALQAGMIRELKKRLDVPVLCFFQGEDSFVDGLPEPFREACWQAMRERLPEADLLVAPSRFYADLMQRRLDAPDLGIEVLPNGIDLEGYGPAADKSGPPVIGYLARLMKEKGLALLVEAFVHLRNELGHPDCQLRIAGTATKENDPLVRELQERLRSEGLADDVSWHANISREEKAGLLAGMSLFSVPVIYPEAFGLYVVEAMASGVAVVQPDAAAFPEIVGATGGGVLVKPGDATALAAEWHRLLGQPDEMRELGERGRRGAEEHYSVGTMRERFTEIARRVAAGNQK